MFTLLKLFFSVALLATVAGGIFYFLPSDVKLDGLEKLSGLVPGSVKEKVEALTLTPPEKRGKLIDKLNEDLIILSSSADATELSIIENAQKLLDELKNKNEEVSLTELAKIKLVESLLEKNKNICSVEVEPTTQ